MSILKIPTARKFVPLQEPSRYKGVFGGRGSGKSRFFGTNLIRKAILHESRYKHGLRWLCAREIQKSLDQSVKRLLEDEIKRLNVGHLFEVQRSLIKTPGDGIIAFQGLQDHTSESIKSLEDFDGAWLEEAQTISQRSLDLLRPTIRKEYDDGTSSEIWFSWNPRFEDDPVDVFFRSKKNPPPANSRIIEVNFEDNPWFPNVLREEMRYDRQRDPDKYIHIWRGGYLKNSEARVFKNWKEEQFETHAGARFFFGGDWGFANDPTVLVRCYIIGRTLFIDREAYKVGCEIDYTPALFAGDAPRAGLWENPYKYPGIPGAHRWPITADSARPETISYMQKRGFKIEGAKKGQDSVKEGVDFLKNYDIVVHPSCRHTIDELTMYSYKVDKQTQQVLPVLEDKKNHVIDSLRYALEGVRNGSFYTLDNL